MDTFQTLRDIITDKFEKNTDAVTLDSSLESLGIDSLDTFDIIFEAEEKFGIKVPNDQVNIATVGDVVVLIDRLRSEQGIE
ncbi:MAG: acyl carrier protein [Methylophilaceae bacterium]|nr:acyl carrier protein [Methylophilaceae bacterium]